MTAFGSLNRRSFLAAGAALGGAVLGRAGPGPQQRGKPRGVRFGVRSPLQGTTLRERALLLKELGYDGLELGPEWLERPLASIEDEMQGTGIAISAIVGSLKLLDTDAKVRAQAVELDQRRLEMASALGADAVIEVPIFGPNRFQDLSPLMTPRQIEDRLLVAGLKALAPTVQRTGVKIVIEPLARKYTHYMIFQRHGAEIIEAVGAPGFNLLSDFYHMQLEEKDIARTLARDGKYTGYVHLADGEKRTEPGSLPFDYRPGFTALKNWGYEGWLTVESEASDTPRDALTRALKYLKQQWSEA